MATVSLVLLLAALSIAAVARLARPRLPAQLEERAEWWAAEKWTPERWYRR